MTRLRLFGAVLLVACLALPMSTCGADGSAQYVLSEIEANPLTWFWAVAFLWPVPLFLLRRRLARGSLGKFLFSAEPLLLFGSLYAVSIFTAIGVPSIGCYTGWIAITLHGFVWVSEARARRRCPSVASFNHG